MREHVAVGSRRLQQYFSQVLATSTAMPRLMEASSKVTGEEGNNSLQLADCSTFLTYCKFICRQHVALAGLSSHLDRGVNIVIKLQGLIGRAALQKSLGRDCTMWFEPAILNIEYNCLVGKMVFLTTEWTKFVTGQIKNTREFWFKSLGWISYKHSWKRS